VDRPSRARRRFHTDRIVANRRARFLREHHNNTLSPIVDELLQYGRFADRDSWDCGHRCYLLPLREADGRGYPSRSGEARVASGLGLVEGRPAPAGRDGAWYESRSN
jgi:hypothetical protein